MKYIATLALAFITLFSNAQTVQQVVVVEHFTNSLCAVCASRNPGFIQNLEANKDVIHLSFHPSRPYSACILNKHNTSGNDDRAKYYNIYGSTPRIVVNGSVISSSTNYSSATIFDPYKDQATSIDLNIEQKKWASDSIEVIVTVKNLSNSDLDMAQLTVLLVEDTVFYNAPNGEKEHYNVFRKELTAVAGNSIEVPTTGDSISYRFSSSKHSDWDFNRITAFAQLQNADKKVIQAKILKAEKADGSTGIKSVKEIASFSIYPNPAQTLVKLSHSGNYKLYNSKGQIEMDIKASQNSFSIESLTKGIYWLRKENSAEVVQLIKL